MASEELQATTHDSTHYAELRHPAEDVDSSTSPLVFPWDKTQAKLDAEKEIVA